MSVRSVSASAPCCAITSAARFGQRLRSPLFEVYVPLLAHALADPDKGTGLVMVCTFGDLNDVLWWRELQLPTRSIIGRTRHRAIAQQTQAL